MHHPLLRRLDGARKRNENTPMISRDTLPDGAAVGSDAMADAGISNGDVLLVDRAIKPEHGLVVNAVVEGELVDAADGCSRGNA